MLNHFTTYKKQIDDLLLKINDKSLTNSFTEISNYINKTINILNSNPSETSEIHIVINNFSEELKNLLSICTLENISTISPSEIHFSTRLILELGKEIEKYWKNICDFEIMDTNAEMKLLENILKEDGFFEESN